MTEASTSWRVEWEAPASTRRMQVFRAFLFFPLSLVPFGVWVWFLGRVIDGNYRLGNDVSDPWFDLVIAVAFALSLPLVAGVLAWTSLASLFDGLGAERTVEGEVTDLEAYRAGSSTTWSMRVGGRYIVLPRLVFEQLRDGQLVQVRVSRFRCELIELSRPAGTTPAGLGFGSPVTP